MPRREYELAIVIDANGEALIAEFDQATGAISRTHKAADLMGDATERAGKQSETGARGVRRFGEQAGNMQRHISGAIGLLAKMGGVLTGALGVGMSVNIAKQIEFGDQVHKLNQRLGASTEALSEYAHVAKLTGVEFNQLTIGWQRQTRRIAEAAKGTGEARGALRELGLEAKALASLAPEDQFEAIADRMALVTEESDRVRIGMKLWDSEGVALLQTIQGGSGALREMRQEARDLGLSLSGEQAAQMAQARDSATRLQGAIDGLGTSLAINLAPAMTNITNYIAEDLVPRFSDWLARIGAIDLAITDMTKRQAETRLGVLIRDIDEVVAAQERFEFVPGALDPFDGIRNRRLEELTAEKQQVKAHLQDLDRQALETEKRLRDMGTGAGAASGQMNLLANSTGALVQQFVGEADAVQQFIAGLEEQTAALTLSDDAMLRLTASKVKAQLQDEALGVAVDQLVERYIAAKNAAEDQVESEKQLLESRTLHANVLQQLEARYDPIAAAVAQWNAVEAELITLLDDEETNQNDLARALEWVRQAREDDANAADLQLNPHKQLIEQLGEENEALALAITRNESLEVARARLRGATEADIAQLQRLQTENAVLGEQYQQLGGEVDEFTAAMMRGVERLDDAFADFFYNILSEGKASFSALKDLLLRTLAEMAHAAFTRRIVVQLSVAVSGGGANFASAGGFPGQVPGGGGLGSFMGLLQGGQIGNFFTGLPSWLGGNAAANLGPTYGIPQSGLFGGAGQYSNAQYGIAGILGYLGGDAIFGGQGGLGGSLGATIGMAAGGPIGAIVGGLIGGFVGGVFGDRPFEAGIGGEGARRRADNQTITTPFGNVVGFDGRGGFGDLRDPSTPGGQLGEGIREFDEAIASFVGADNIGRITEEVRDWEVFFTGSALNLENVLGSRWSAILGAFPQDVRDFVLDVEGIEAQVGRLAVAVDIEKLIDANKELFGDRVFADVVAAAESIQGAEEDITSALNRLVQTMQVVVAAGQQLDQLASLDPVALAREQYEMASRTVYSTVDPLTSALREAIAGFDGTAESLLLVVDAAGSLRQAQTLLAGQYIELEGIISGFGSSIEDRFNRVSLGDAGYYDMLNDRFQDLSGRLQTETDPQVIASLLAQLEETANNMVGLLSDEQLAEMGPEILAALANVRLDAESRRLLGLDQLEDAADVTTAEIERFQTMIGDPLEIAAGSLIEAAEDLSDAADRLNPPGSGAVPPGRSPDDPYRVPSPVYHDPHSAVDSDVLVTAVTNAVGASSGAVIQAIRDGFATVQVNVIVQQQGARTNA